MNDAPSEGVTARPDGKDAEESAMIHEDPDHGEGTGRGGCGTMYLTLVGFLAFGLASAIVYLFMTYARNRPPLLEGTRIGEFRYVEISLIREDFNSLACAADTEFQGTYCAYRADGQRRPERELDEARIIRQYNTVRNELFMAAGLWAQPAMMGELPTERFSVLCEFTPIGAMKNPKVRWGSTMTFNPAKANLVVGKVSNCVIPR